ncbi:uncharacterized protein ACLA_078030 [Aspergillus clavatus NRRL 1]|uniref:Uncharacterized protein n=1 Tax=Aspergillus clavatus (strain ATCC 1007 / CBS 513.65 / DSM 816 / NCTC 3887 / NRRL 1 / QM 1276 / 107) TaxID=344612 RepID=A1CLS6_ASPCL|nr:uncharacterized protein ACLA_078030 [Aspergillus clavatus NRRL 1]EAW09055.1 hypothetical protein ACLA_078030 [Aspergillus clavatus NRRL 1]
MAIYVLQYEYILRQRVGAKFPTFGREFIRVASGQFSQEGKITDNEPWMEEIGDPVPAIGRAQPSTAQAG